MLRVTDSDMLILVVYKLRCYEIDTEMVKVQEFVQNSTV